MAHNFLPYNQDQLFLLPPSLREWVGEGSLPRFVSDLVDELNATRRLDAFYAQYRSDGWGRAAYHPCMMLKVLLYGYARGVRSSRKLAQALSQDVGFRYLAANQQPDFRTISDFRKTHLPALEALFVTSLDLCGRAGLLDLGCVALDGRKLAGNASAARNRRREQLEKMAQDILAEAEETDAREDRLFGEDKRGDELPQELQTQAGRLKQIRTALAEVDGERAKVEEKQAERVRAWEEAKAAGRTLKGKKPSKTPRKRALKRAQEFRANLTDPDSRKLKARRGWVQGYNGQIMVDCTHQVIVAQDLTNEADDRIHAGMMLERCEAQAGERPEKCLMDAGYWSEENAVLGRGRTDLLIAVDRESLTLAQHSPAAADAKKKQLPEARKMRARLQTEEGRNEYRKRASTVEPVFGQMSMRDLNRFLLRSLRKVKGEWSLFCTTHNLLKVWRSGWSPQPA